MNTGPAVGSGPRSLLPGLEYHGISILLGLCCSKTLQIHQNDLSSEGNGWKTAVGILKINSATTVATTYKKTYGLGWKIAGIFPKTRLLISTYQENTQLMFIKWANLLCSTKLLPNFLSPENSACDSGGFQSHWGIPCPSSMWFSDVPWINHPFWSTPIYGKFPSQVMLQRLEKMSAWPHLHQTLHPPIFSNQNIESWWFYKLFIGILSDETWTASDLDLSKHGKLAAIFSPRPKRLPLTHITGCGPNSNGW